MHGVHTVQLPTTMNNSAKFFLEIFKDSNLSVKVLKSGKGVKGRVLGCVGGKG